MTRKYRFLTGLTFLGINNLLAQTQPNEFIIGMYGCDMISTSSGQVVTTAKIGNNYTSWYGVLAEDGFNTVVTTQPGLWNDYNDVSNRFRLIKNNKNPYDNK